MEAAPYQGSAEPVCSVKGALITRKGEREPKLRGANADSHGVQGSQKLRCIVVIVSVNSLPRDS